MCLRLSYLLVYSLVYYLRYFSIYLLPLEVGIPLALESIVVVLKLALFWDKLFALSMHVRHVSLALSHSITFLILVLLFGQNPGLLVFLLLDLPLLFVVDALKYRES